MVKKFSEFLKIERTVIKSPEVFSFAYVPEEIVERGETSRLYNEASKFINYGIPNNILLIGPPGSGKTVTLNYVRQQLKELKPNLMVSYVNCSDKTASTIMNILAQNLSRKKLSEEQQIISFLSQLTGNILIVLDEIDKGINLRHLLYSLSRPAEILENFKYSISLILVSNDLNWDDSLDLAVRSSLQSTRISFENYSKNDIIKILTGRAKVGFNDENCINQKLLEKIAETVSEKYHGDCRIAIKILLYSAQSAESKNRETIEEHDIEVGVPKAIKDIEKDKLSRLSNRDFLALYAIQQSLDKTVEGVYNKFLELIPLCIDIKPVKETMFHHILEYLDTHGLIKKKIEFAKQKEGPPKRISDIRCIIKKEILEEELKGRLLKLTKR